MNNQNQRSLDFPLYKAGNDFVHKLSSQGVTFAYCQDVAGNDNELRIELQVHIAKQTIVSHPINIAQIRESFEYDRMVINLEMGACAVFQDSATAPIDQVTLKLAPYANAQWLSDYTVAEENNSEVHLRINVQDHARFVGKNILAGNGSFDFVMDIMLNGVSSEAQVTIASIQYGSGESMIKTTQQHQASNTTSMVRVKQLVGGNSKSMYESLVAIDPNAKNSVAHQQHKALLLSKNAQARANPQLNVQYNKHVQCSHGSAISRIDQQCLWYMMTRGIIVENAQSLLLHGFLADIAVEQLFEPTFEMYLKKIQQEIDKNLG